MAGFYYVYVRTKVGPVSQQKRDLLERSLNLAHDWFRYAPDSWIIYTAQDARMWYERLSKYKKDGWNILICKVDMSDRLGWMPKAFWEWVSATKKKYEPSSDDLLE